MKFKGILPALVTPLCENESINRTVPEQLPEHLLGKGADSFYIAEATGEGLALRAKRRGLGSHTPAQSASSSLVSGKRWVSSRNARIP